MGSCRPGEIAVEKLPSLKNIVVIDNVLDPTESKHTRTGEDAPCAVDFRDVLIWREDTRERKMHKQIKETLHHDDVINMQFTSGTTGAPKAVCVRFKLFLYPYKRIVDRIPPGKGM